jgi:hypothetical protein
MRARLLRLVAVVQHECALGEEEADEAGAHQQPDPVRVADGLDRLGEDVKERDGDDHAAGQRDRRRELPRQPQGDDAARERREHRQPRERDRHPRHEAHALMGAEHHAVGLATLQQP